MTINIEKKITIVANNKPRYPLETTRRAMVVCVPAGMQLLPTGVAPMQAGGERHMEQKTVPRRRSYLENRSAADWEINGASNGSAAGGG